jgi:hypothetical protein
VSRHQKLLSDGGLGIFRIQPDAAVIIPSMDNKTIQYGKHSLNGYIHLEMWQAVWGLPDILKVQILRDCGTTNHAPSRSHWWWTILALNMRIKMMWIT